MDYITIIYNNIYLTCHQLHWFIATAIHFTYIHNGSILHRMVKIRQTFKITLKILLAAIQHDEANISSMSCEI